MKRLLPLVALSVTSMSFAAPAFAEDGAALMASKACTACHNAEKDQSMLGLGPSLKQIGAAYADNKDGLIKFLNADPTAKAIVKPELYPVMQGQQQVSKTWTDEEKAAVADYMISLK